MIAAYDVGNTQVKVFLYDSAQNVIAKKTHPTPDLFEPDSWSQFFVELAAINAGFAEAKKTISCVSWKAFLALRVALGYASKEEFNENLPFDPALLDNLPEDSPFVLESMIPLQWDRSQGLVGTDRLLAAYALYALYKESCLLASLGTATTIDLVTAEGVFFSGVIAPGVDSGYGGLLNRTPHLPSIMELPKVHTLLKTDVPQALAGGTFVGHAVMLEGFFSRMRRDAALEGNITLVLTGGRAYSVSPFIRIPYIIREDLVGRGLFLLSHIEQEPAELKEISEFLTYERPDPVVEEFSIENHPPEPEKKETLFQIRVDEEIPSDSNENL